MTLTATEKEMEDYVAGKLKLSSKGGHFKLVPATHRRTDQCITPLEKRAYYRCWYLKNRKARLAKQKAYNQKKRSWSISPMAYKDNEVAYMKAWRLKNKEHCRAYAKANYLKKHPKAKLTLLQRFITWAYGG